MEHNDKEQHAHLDGYQPFGQPQARENGDASATFVPAVLARLGLHSAPLSPVTLDEQVLDALKSPAWQVRLRAIQQLEMLDERICLIALSDALHDEHENVRAAAVRALDTLPSQSAVEPLLQALRDPAWTVRAAAVLTLGKLKERIPVEPLVAALHDEDSSVRAAAASVLGMLGERAPLSPLANALNDPEWTVREAAVLALGKLGTRVPAELLLTARTDQDHPVRQAAEMVLQQFHPEYRLGADESAVPTINRGLRTRRGRFIAPIADSSAPVAGFIRQSSLSSTKQQKRRQRQPILSRPRLFSRLAAGVAATLVIIAALLSWSTGSYRPQLPSGHLTATSTSGISTYHTAGGSVYKVVWSPDGSEIASTNAAGLVQIWNTSTGHTISTYDGHFLKVLSLSWLPNQPLLVAAEGIDRSVQVWNVLTGKRILTTSPLHGIASAATWSPDGRKIAFDGGDNTVQVWNIVNGKRLVTYTGHTARITTVSWSADGTEIASGSVDRTVQVWNAATGHKDWPSFVHADAVSFVAWSPNNKLCAVATVNGLVEIWDNPSWQNVEIAPADKGWSDLNNPLVISIAWSPDARHLAFISLDGQVQVWDAVTMQLLSTYASHSGQVNNVAWSPDGTHIASASADGTVQVWTGPYSIEAGKPRPK